MALLSDILRSSKEVRRLIVEKSLEYGIPLRYICEEVGVEYSLFMMQYINSRSDVSKLEITDEQFEKILHRLGIEIRYQFVIDKTRDMTTEARKYVDDYESSANEKTRRKNVTKEKGNTASAE